MQENSTYNGKGVAQGDKDAALNGKGTARGGKRPQPASTVRLWTLVFVIIIALSFCCFIMGQGLNAGTSVFLVGRGYGASLPGALALTFSFSAAVARIVVGPVIDRGKCSPTILVGIVILVGGTFLSSLVDSVPLFAVSRILQGVGFAAATTAAATAAADVLPAERLGEGIGYYGLAQALAMSVGPAFALFLVGTDPSTNLYVGLSLVGVVGFIVALGARYERHPERLPITAGYRIRWEKRQGPDAATQGTTAQNAAARSEVQGESAASDEGPSDTDGCNSDKVRPQDANGKRGKFAAFDVFEKRALPGALPMAVICPTFGFGIFFAGLYGTTLGYANAGLFYTVSAVTMVAVRLLSKRFMDTVPAIRTYTVAVACGIAAFAMLYFAGSGEAVFLAAGLPYGICLGISLPLNQSVAVKNTPSERWGAANALFLLFNDLGIGLASAIWGAINELFGFQVSIIAVIVCQLLSYLVAWVVYPSDQKK